MAEAAPAWTQEPPPAPYGSTVPISELRSERRRSQSALPFRDSFLCARPHELPRRELSNAARRTLGLILPRTTQSFACLAAPVRERRRGNWISFEFGDPADLPAVPACYALLVDGEMAYIGQTKNLSLRFRAHPFCLIADRDEPVPMWLTPWGIISAFRLQFRRRVSGRYGDWLMHEARLIRRLTPRFNRSVI